jgi:hypothetical protein
VVKVGGGAQYVALTISAAGDALTIFRTTVAPVLGDDDIDTAAADIDVNIDTVDGDAVNAADDNNDAEVDAVKSAAADVDAAAAVDSAEIGIAAAADSMALKAFARAPPPPTPAAPLPLPLQSTISVAPTARRLQGSGRGSRSTRAMQAFIRPSTVTGLTGLV